MRSFESGRATLTRRPRHQPRRLPCGVCCFAIAASVLILGQSGCIINIYSSDPNRRVLELLNQSEDLRQIEYEWERIWFTDMPSHLTPEQSTAV